MKLHIYTIYTLICICIHYIMNQEIHAAVKSWGFTLKFLIHANLQYWVVIHNVIIGTMWFRSCTLQYLARQHKSYMHAWISWFTLHCIMNACDMISHMFLHMVITVLIISYNKIHCIITGLDLKALISGSVSAAVVIILVITIVSLCCGVCYLRSSYRKKWVIIISLDYIFCMMPTLY